MSEETSWYVVTGAPFSGKSRTLDRLAFFGYPVVPEAARVFVHDELSKGKPLDEIRGDEVAFQRQVLALKVEAEERTATDRLTFFERGIPDSIAYNILCGEDNTSALEASKRKRYRGVFLLDPLNLPFEKDHARTESEAKARKLDELLFSAYTNLGYSVVRVPVMTISERVQFILNTIQK